MIILPERRYLHNPYFPLWLRVRSSEKYLIYRRAGRAPSFPGVSAAEFPSHLPPPHKSQFPKWNVESLRWFRISTACVWGARIYLLSRSLSLFFSPPLLLCFILFAYLFTRFSPSTALEDEDTEKIAKWSMSVGGTSRPISQVIDGGVWPLEVSRGVFSPRWHTYWL